MQGSNADVVPFLDGYAFRFHVFQYLLRLHLLIEAVFRYNHGRASVASLGFCVATLFYRILPSDALFFYIKKAAAFLQPPQHIFLFLFLRKTEWDSNPRSGRECPMRIFGSVKNVGVVVTLIYFRALFFLKNDWF